jgi:hypothetical protein
MLRNGLLVEYRNTLAKRTYKSRTSEGRAQEKAKVLLMNLAGAGASASLKSAKEEGGAPPKSEMRCRDSKGGDEGGKKG